MFYKKLRTMTPFFILDVLIMKGDIIIYFSIMDKKNKKRPDKKIIFYLYTFYFYVIKKWLIIQAV